MKIVLAFVISFVLTGTISCAKHAGSKAAPGCIAEKIKAFEAQPVKNPPVEIWQYEYKGKTVYYITPYCCDIMSEVYDASCQKICSPDGGITGTGDGKCSDFHSEKKNGKLIWKDDRR